MRDHGEKTGYTYKKRSHEQNRKRANQRGGDFDAVLKDGFETWSPKPDVRSKVRIMPPTWDDPEHFGIDVWVHYQIGADKNSYICPNRQMKEWCPICEERERVKAEATEEELRALAPTRRVAYFIIDRTREEDGPLVWLAAWTVDRDIMAQAEVEGEWLEVDHPDEGFDLIFKRDGQGLKTKYNGIKFSRHASPISDDAATQKKWLRLIVKNPIPTILNHFDGEYIQKVFAGTVSKKEASSGTDAAPETRSGSRKAQRKYDFDDDDDGDEDLEVPPRKSRVRDEDDDEPDPPRRKTVKKKAKKVVSKTKTKKRSVTKPGTSRVSEEARRILEDDDDEDFPF